MKASTGGLRLGFVGVGSMGQCAHLKNYAGLPGCRVVALAELRPRTAGLVAARYGVGKVYADAGAMLKKERLDGIVCSQPFTRHGVLLKELAKCGKPIFIEKPLCGSLEVGKQILAALKKGKSRVMVGYHKRSDPATDYAVKEIARLKRSGELGRMKYVRIIMPAGDWIAGGFADLINAGDKAPRLTFDPRPGDMDEGTYKRYLTFINYYIHQINLMRFLLGERYEVTYADESGVLFVGKSRSGVPCTIEMSPYATRIDWQEQALVCFEHGWIRLELPAPLASHRPGKVTIHRELEDETPETLQPDLPWVHAMRQQASNFVRFAAGKAKAPCGAPEALEDLRIARDYIRLFTGK